MIQRINESLAVLQSDYKSNLNQLKNQFPFLKEYMYERVLLSVENDLSKAIDVAKVIHQQNPIYVIQEKKKDQVHHSDTSPKHHDSINNSSDDSDKSLNDTTYTNYDLEECKTNMSIFIFKRNHAFKEAAKAYRKAKTHRFYSDIVMHYYKKGREYDSKVKLWSMRAKLCMIQYNPSQHKIDLHGLTITEAIPLVKKVITQWWNHEKIHRKDIPIPLEIITGAGFHSKNGQPKIKPAVLQFLNKEGWLIDENPGKIIIRGIQTYENPIMQKHRI